MPLCISASWFGNHQLDIREEERVREVFVAPDIASYHSKALFAEL